MMATLARSQPLKRGFTRFIQHATRATGISEMPEKCNDRLFSPVAAISCTPSRTACVSAVTGRSWAPPSNAEKRPFSTAVDIPISGITTVFDAHADVFYANAMHLKHGTTNYPEESKNGKTLQQNKGDLLYAADKNDASASEKAIILAIAMSETQHIDGNEFDAGKPGEARNETCLNLNIAMLKEAGWDEERDGADLSKITGCLIKWLRGEVRTSNSKPTNHVRDALNYVRGGVTAFEHNGNFNDKLKKPADAEVYRNAIASIYRELFERPHDPMYDDGEGFKADLSKKQYHDSTNLWANNTRLWVDVPPV